MIQTYEHGPELLRRRAEPPAASCYGVRRPMRTVVKLDTVVTPDGQSWSG
jgi:hypothetical protein